MKKILFAAIIAAAGALTFSCNQVPRPSLDNNVDTLSYEVGMAYSDYAKRSFEQMGVDSANVDEFYKGIKEGVDLTEEDKKELAYYMGVMFGLQMRQQLEGFDGQLFPDSTQKISRRNFIAGLGAALNNKSTLKINGQVIDAQKAGEDADKRMRQLRAAQFAGNLKAGKEFLAKKAKEEGVQALEGGVLYKVITAGTGALPKADDQVEILYEGTLIDGTKFDGNYEGGEPMTCIPAQMIPGFKTALINMPVGSEWEIYIPSELAYGDRETGGPIKPNSVLVFKVKVLNTKAASAPTPQPMPGV